MLSSLFRPPPPSFSSLIFLQSLSKPPFLSFLMSSSNRTVADVLMANARRAAQKKSPKTLDSPTTTAKDSSPLKKRKTLDPPIDEPQPPDSKPKDLTVELKRKGADFKPKSVATWKAGEPVPFLFLARAFDVIGSEPARIVMTDVLANVFRTVMATTPADLLAMVYLSANRIAPPHEGLELGIGEAGLVKAVAEAYGRKEEHVRKQQKELGDLGLVAKASRSSQKMMFKPQPLTVAKVLDTFRTIAKESGKDSQDKKRNHIKSLLVAATDCEPLYIVRLLQGKMRIGLAEKTVLAALGQAALHSETLPPPPSQIQAPLDEASNIMKQVYSVLPIYDKIVPALLSVGLWKLSEVCDFSLGVPVGPMLAKPTKAVSEILDKFQGIEFTCEYKYDGERAQIHYMEDGSVEIYSRNAERNTGKYPDVVNAMKRVKKPDVKSFVLDCEIVAYDREKNRILPFQILSTRARKGVILSDIKVAVCTYAFDILYINGQPLLREQLKLRREHLYSSCDELPGEFQFATAIASNDLEEIQKFLDTAVNTSCEGLIIKTLDKDATYEPSKRSNNWLKLKKDYMDSVGDSLDLVPIAAFHGRGKRTGVYGSFLLACYDEHNEEYQSICNIGTGFSEVQLEERSASLRGKIISKPKPYYRYADSVNPDVWFEPSEVWEVKAADLSISPVHRAANGVVDPNKGISLRFPRLQRVREDKNPDQATTSEQNMLIIKSQKKNPPVAKMIVLVLAMIIGVYICLICVKQKGTRSSPVILKIQQVEQPCSYPNLPQSEVPYVHFPQPTTYKRNECKCTPVRLFAVLSMQRSGSGWFETLLNSHINVSSNGEIFSVKERRTNISTIIRTMDQVYNLDWVSSASKNECTAAVGFKWMLNQGLLKNHDEIVSYFKRRGVYIIFLFRRNLLSRWVSVLSNEHDRSVKQLNGTHKAHVHSKDEADVLARYKPRINVSLLIPTLNQSDQWSLDALEYFNSTSHIVLYYEDLVRHHTMLEDVLDFLRVPRRKLKSRQVRIHTRPLSDQVENWDEVSRALNGTKYESFLQT